MLSNLNTYVELYNIGDLSSIAGVIISIIGFLLTIITLLRSKKLLSKTKEAVEKSRSDMRKTDTVVDVAIVVSEMEEIKRLHREKSMTVLPYRYTNLRKSLISIRSSNETLDDTDKRVIQSVISFFSVLERDIDLKIKNDNHDIDFPKINNLISNHSDKLQEVLINKKNNIGA